MRKLVTSVVFILIFFTDTTFGAEIKVIQNCVNIKTGSARLVSDTLKKCKKNEKLVKLAIPFSESIKGNDGSTILSGENEPKIEIGKLGDFYIDTLYKFMYGPKTKDGWGTGFSIIGPTRGYGGGGPQGPKGDTGATGAKGDPGGFGDYGAFHDTTTDTLTANTATAIQLNTTDFSRGISIENDSNGKPSLIRFSTTGKYNIAFSSQINKADTGTDIISIWLKKYDVGSATGNNLAWTNTDLYLIGKDVKQVAAWNFFVDVTAGQAFQLMISAGTSTGSQIISLPAQSNPIRPEIPGTILTVNQIG